MTNNYYLRISYDLLTNIMALIREYFEYQDLFEKKYGKNTIVLMEIW